jgi:hypothetical protein
MLQPTPFPSTYPTPRKLAVFEEQATHLGFHDNFYHPPLTTSFSSGINQAGVHMRRSTGSGNECTGVNDGSKNSVLVTTKEGVYRVLQHLQRKGREHDQVGYCRKYESLPAQPKLTRHRGSSSLWVLVLSEQQRSSCVLSATASIHRPCWARD